MYDSYDWMSRFGDPGYRAHRAGAQLVALMAARLANAELLPYDYVAFGTELTRLVAQLDSGITRKQWTVSTQGLKDALGRFTDAARALARARDSALATADSTRASRANAALMQVERRLTRPQGLASRPWYTSLQFASDVDNGYATMAFPSVNEAIRHADAATAERELADLVGRVDDARGALDQAAAAALTGEGAPDRPHLVAPPPTAKGSAWLAIRVRESRSSSGTPYGPPCAPRRPGSPCLSFTRHSSATTPAGTSSGGSCSTTWSRRSA